jgi:hypothetical protein
MKIEGASQKPYKILFFLFNQTLVTFIFLFNLTLYMLAEGFVEYEH